MKITLISDTHTKHKQVTDDLPGGDLLIHSGDISSMGYLREIKEFCEWFASLDSYAHKVFIAGNHDWGFSENVEPVKEVLAQHPNITYLQDDSVTIVTDDLQESIKIWGSPWQPRFYDWAFNADRGEDIKQHWDKIPEDIDILITHGPAYGFLDRVKSYRGYSEPLGCEELIKAIARIKPKIHTCGHIHSGHGYVNYNGIHFFNASLLNESYWYDYFPTTFEWTPSTNEIIINS